MSDSNRIQQRAYEIWEREGRPGNRHAEHWIQACQECEAEDGAAAMPAGSGDTAPSAASMAADATIQSAGSGRMAGARPA